MTLAKKGNTQDLKKVKVVFRTEVTGMDALNRLMKRVEAMIKRFETLGKQIDETRVKMEAFTDSAGRMAAQLERAATAISTVAKKQKGINAGFSKRLRENKQMLALQRKIADLEAGRGPAPRGGGPGSRGGGRRRMEDGFMAARMDDMKGAAQEMMFVVRAARAAAFAYGAILAALPAQAFAERALETKRKADFVGMSRQNFMAFDAISKQFGAGEGDLMDLLGTLSDRSLDVVKGTGYIEDFKLLGLAAKDLAGPDGHLKSTVDLLYTFSDAVLKIQNPAERVGAVMRVLGDDVGRKMGPMVMYGSERLREMVKEMEVAGVVFNEASESLGVNFALALRRTGVLMGAQYSFLGLSLIPAFMKLADTFNRIALTNAPWLRTRLSELSIVWEKMSTAVADNVEAFDGWLKKGGMSGGIYQAVDQLTSSLLGLAGVLAVMNAGAILTFAGYLGIIAAGLIVIDDWLVYMKGGDAAFPWEKFAEGANKIKTSFGELATSVRDLGAAFAELIGGGGEDSLLAKWLKGVEMQATATLEAFSKLADLLTLVVRSIEVLGAAAGYAFPILSKGFTNDLKGYRNSPEDKARWASLTGATDKYMLAAGLTPESFTSEAMLSGMNRLTEALLGSSTTITNSTNISVSGVTDPGSTGGSLLRSAPTAAAR
jgi:hypothetical protein